MYLLFKRIFDVFFSLILIVLLLPFFVPIIIILRFSGEGEIFYFQERVGLKNKRFYIWKFATMLKDSENIGTGSITVKNDFRVTKFGKILRKTKINELPQLFNILKGDISVVGPRPLVYSTFTSYSPQIQSKIYDSKPGLTGIGSIVFRDEETIIAENSNDNPHEFYNEYIAPYKGSLELWYQNNASMKLDLQIIFLTSWVVLFSNSNLVEIFFSDLPKKTF